MHGEITWLITVQGEIAWFNVKFDEIPQLIAKHVEMPW